MKYDVIIIGGGTAGSIAAISALNKGLSVLIVEKSISLCGSMTNSLVTPMMPSYVNSGLSNILKSQFEYFEQRKLTDDTLSFWFNPESYNFLIEQEILKKKGVILYNSILINATVINKTITEIEVLSFNNKIKLFAKTFIDCSSDATLARFCGIKTSSGDEFNINQSTSFRFEIGNINIEKLRKWCFENNYTFNNCLHDSFFEFVHVPGNKFCGNLLNIFQKAKDDGLLETEDIRYIQGFAIPTKPHTMSFNGPQLPNLYKYSDPFGQSIYVSKGRLMQRRLHTFLKNNIPGFENSFISKEASSLGTRESYRIIGKYVLNELDYLNRQKFTDGVVKADWYVDIHTDNLKVEDDSFKTKYDINEYYEIPYRCLITNEIHNYIAAGRHISTTFKVQSSIRIQVTCQDMGEICGIAVYHSLKNNIHLNEIDGAVIKKEYL